MTDWTPEKIQKMTERLEDLYVSDEIVEAEMAHGHLEEHQEDAVEHSARVKLHQWIEALKTQ